MSICFCEGTAMTRLPDSIWTCKCLLSETCELICPIVGKKEIENGIGLAHVCHLRRNLVELPSGIDLSPFHSCGGRLHHVDTIETEAERTRSAPASRGVLATLDKQMTAGDGECLNTDSNDPVTLGLRASARRPGERRHLQRRGSICWTLSGSLYMLQGLRSGDPKSEMWQRCLVFR